uniref:CCHC-type domain-containing protein n=1 Tax=Brassica oleracea var. oleracea TaxID=109376 RepID=A0A0D2ZVN0_BRAOL
MGDEDGSAHSIRKFDGTDYAFWSMQIEDYLYEKKLHQPLSKKPEKMDQDEWELLDRQVMGVISWEPMRVAVSNYVSTQKLKFNDVRDRILGEEVRRIDSGEASTSSAFNVENRGRNPDRNNRSNGRSKSRNGWGQSKFRQPTECWNCGKTGHIKKNFRAPPKKEDNTRGGANAVTREIADAL